MNKKHDLLGIFLAGTTGTALLVAMLLRAFLPRIILPKLDIIAVIALCLVALVLDCYIARGSRRDFRLIPIYGALIFGLFPYAAAFTNPSQSLILALVGAITFTVLTLLFDSMVDRLSSSPSAPLAPAIGAFGLFLASQCLMGMFKI